MKIQINKDSSVCHAGKIHKKGTVVDLPTKDARFLIEKEHATEYTEPAPAPAGEPQKK
jgi:hypothetical protein